MKKVTKSELGLDFSNLSGEPRAFLEKNADMVCAVINKALDGCATAEEVEGKFKALNDSLKGVDAEGYARLVNDNETLSEQVKSLGESFEKLKQNGLSAGTINRFKDKIEEMFDSEKFTQFAEGHALKTGKFEGFSLKDIVSMTDNYAGDVLISQQQSRVVSQIANKRLHMRDVLTVLQGDPQYPNLTFAQVHEFDRNARYVSENGTLPESSIAVKETTYQTKRLGTHLRISKRMLKSRVYITSFIMNMLPEAVFMAEDWNILFGNGNGENLEGIASTKGVESVESVIGTAVVTGAAGAVKDVTAYGDDALIEFAKPYDIILDGMMITFANATTTALNGTHAIIKVNDRQILVKGVKITSETASAITFTVKNSAFKSIESPNSLDVIKTAFAVMTYAQYYPNAIILNPITVNAIESEKDTMGRNLGLVTVGAGGAKSIAGRPIIEYAGIPAGKYLLGDFTQAANLVDYTSLTLEWAEDVNTKLSNEVVLIAQEEVIFPVYMPWAFAYGELSALKTAITK